MLIKIVIGNLLHKWGATLISMLLLTSGIAIVVLVVTVQKQVETKVDRDLQDIDLVVGAKGSPLQLVLSSVYHIDAPTGNIKLSDAEKIMNNPMIEEAIPLAYGDSYKGCRIVGTDSNYVAKYNGKIAVGKMFTAPMEAVVGSAVAQAGEITVGASFVGTHGLHSDDEHRHEAFGYTVTGILAPTHSVLDNLILTPVTSVWMVHDEAHASHDHDTHDHDAHEESDHDETEKELTGLLIKYRTPMAQMTLPRFINEQTNMQAAVPVLEMNRLMGMMGTGVTTLQAVAALLMLIAAISVFTALYSRLAERKYEMALMRSMGCSRSRLLMIVLLEALVISVISFAAGLGLGSTGIGYFNNAAEDSFQMRVRLDGISFSDLTWLLGITLLLGVLAAAIPAIKAYYLNISKTLANG